MVRYKRLSFMGYYRYRVGTDGSTWSLSGRVLRKKYGKWKPLAQTILVSNKKKYLRVKLVNENGTRPFLVHRLILLAFEGPCPEGMEGCHDDNNGLHNCINNLRWDTPSGNQRDRVRHGTSLSGRSMNRGELNGRSKLAAEQVAAIRRDYIPFIMGYKKLAKREGVSWGAVRAIIRGDNWRE